MAVLTCRSLSLHMNVGTHQFYLAQVQLLGILITGVVSRVEVRLQRSQAQERIQSRYNTPETTTSQSKTELYFWLDIAPFPPAVGAHIKVHPELAHDFSALTDESAAESKLSSPEGTETPHMSMRFTKFVKRPILAFLLQVGGWAFSWARTCIGSLQMDAYTSDRRHLCNFTHFSLVELRGDFCNCTDSVRYTGQYMCPTNMECAQAK